MNLTLLTLNPLKALSLMATKTAFSPEVMAALKNQVSYIKKTKTATDPFSNFSGPIGRYYARTQRIAVTFERKDQSPIFTFVHSCLAQIPDASSATNIHDQTCFGMTMRVRISTMATEKSTKPDQWERVMVAMQAYGIKTRNFGVRDGIEHPELILVDMAAAVDLVNERKPAVIVDVTESVNQTTKKVSKYVNIREAVDEELVSKFGTIEMEVTDEELAFEEDEASSTSSSEPVLETLTPAQAQEMLAGLTDDQVRDALLEEKAECGTPIPQLTSAQLREAGLAFILKKPLPQFVPTASNPPEAKASADDEEEEDEEDDTTPSKEDPILKLQLHIGTLDRDQLKKAVRNAGGLKEGEKFKSSQTDDYLRELLFNLKTGKVAPVSVVIPDEVPFD